ncbi:MAG: hypothetical protein KF866_01680 [Phycisphaeraceae bacterium]|nr:hypothetical protein [Phycisphaeraceae bacterium]MCW5753597.1 hypothetical protein [Phycisphaeraceae bacterium]
MIAPDRAECRAASGWMLAILRSAFCVLLGCNHNHALMVRAESSDMRRPERCIGDGFVVLHSGMIDDQHSRA